MNAPQIIWIVLVTISLTVEGFKHGESKSGKHNFPASCIAMGLMASLLWWGGFFG